PDAAGDELRAILQVRFDRLLELGLVRLEDPHSRRDTFALGGDLLDAREIVVDDLLRAIEDLGVCRARRPVIAPGAARVQACGEGRRGLRLPTNGRDV